MNADESECEVRIALPGQPPAVVKSHGFKRQPKGGVSYELILADGRQVSVYMDAEAARRQIDYITNVTK